MLAYIGIAIASFVLNSCEEEVDSIQQTEKESISFAPRNNNDTTLAADMIDSDVSLRSTFDINQDWPKGSTIRYKFLGNPTELQKTKFRIYLLEWMSYANLSFKEVSKSQTAEVRVQFTKPGDADQGNWSCVGTGAKRVSDQSEATIHFQILNDKTPKSVWSRKLLHEMGHMLGLKHEHQSPLAPQNVFDTTEVYKWGEKQGWNRSKVYNQVLYHYSADYEVTTNKYDVKSIMMYSLPAECYLSKIAPRQYYILSEWDKDMIRNRYPFNGKLRLFRCYFGIINGQVINRHFYTTNFEELYKYADNESVESSMGLIYDHYVSGTSRLYRFYHPILNDHFYTANYNEYKALINSNSGYTYEGSIGYVYTTAKSNTTPVYRRYNPNTGEHFYTISSNEANTVLNMGFVNEGIAFHIMKD